MTTEAEAPERTEYPTMTVAVRHLDGQREIHHLGAGTTLHTLEQFFGFVRAELKTARTILIRVK